MKFALKLFILFIVLSYVAEGVVYLERRSDLLAAPPYLYIMTGTIFFNETKLNATIDARAVAVNLSMNGSRWSIDNETIINVSGHLEVNKTWINQTIDARTFNESELNATYLRLDASKINLNGTEIGDWRAVNQTDTNLSGGGRVSGNIDLKGTQKSLSLINNSRVGVNFTFGDNVLGDRLFVMREIEGGVQTAFFVYDVPFNTLRVNEKFSINGTASTNLDVHGSSTFRGSAIVADPDSPGLMEIKGLGDEFTRSAFILAKNLTTAVGWLHTYRNITDNRYVMSYRNETVTRGAIIVFPNGTTRIQGNLYLTGGIYPNSTTAGLNISGGGNNINMKDNVKICCNNFLNVSGMIITSDKITQPNSLTLDSQDIFFNNHSEFRSDVNISGNLTFRAGNSLQVGSNQYAFVLDVLPLTGLFFNVASSSYEFTNTVGTAIHKFMIDGDYFSTGGVFVNEKVNLSKDGNVTLSGQLSVNEIYNVTTNADGDVIERRGNFTTIWNESTQEMIFGVKN